VHLFGAGLPAAPFSSNTVTLAGPGGTRVPAEVIAGANFIPLFFTPQNRYLLPTITTPARISPRLLIAAFTLMVLIAIFILVLTSFLSHRSGGEHTATYHHLRVCYVFLEAIQAETGQNLNSALFSHPTNPPHIVFLRLLEDYTKTHGGRFNTNVVLDGWQRPLLFTNDLAPAPWLRIWSAGPNGSNELGSGDDIVYQYENNLVEK
jgi:hypothetical protein